MAVECNKYYILTPFSLDMTKVTHVYPMKPVNGYWMPIPFVSETIVDGSTKHRRGCSGWKIYDSSEIDELIAHKELVRLECPHDLKTNEQVYLTPEGEIWAADEELAGRDIDKTLLGKL